MSSDHESPTGKCGPSLVVLGIGVGLAALSAAMLTLPILSITLGPLLALPAIFLIAWGTDSACLGRLLMVAVAAYIVVVSAVSASIVGNQLLIARRARFTQAHGARPAPAPPSPALTSSTLASAAHASSTPTSSSSAPGAPASPAPAPPVPYGKLFHWLIGPTVAVAFAASSRCARGDRRRIALVWLLTFLIPPLAMLLLYLLSHVWALSA